MNALKLFKPKSFGRHLVIWLTAILLVTSLASTQNISRVLGLDDEGPIIVEPIDIPLPPFEAPANGFAWEVPRRFGTNTTGDAMIDFHYDPVTMLYEQSHLYPSQWPARFIGCQTEADADYAWNGTPNSYTWSIVGVSSTTVNQCIITLNFPAQGTYTVRMEVRDPAGNVVPAGRDPAYFEQEVIIKDYFIVSIGDSLASGEGNPDVGLWATPNTPFPGWTQQRAAVWQDQRCDRSGYSGPAQAALALEAADPHTSVTFISFACSGASLNTPQYAWSLFTDWSLTAPDPNKHLGTGILGPYRGYISDDANHPPYLPYSDDFVGYIPSQMDQLRNALIPPGGQSARQIDAMIVSAGGNDIHFGDIGTACLLTDDCWNNAMLKDDPHTNTYYSLSSLLTLSLSRLQNNVPGVLDHYDLLAAELNTLPPNKPSHVYLLQYADQTRNDTGHTDTSGACQMLDDVFAPISYLAVEPSEAQIAFWQGYTGLNNAVKRAAEEHAADNWQLVDGIGPFEVDPAVPPGTPGLFTLGPDGRGHGYCATDNWIRTAAESEIIQGPVNFRKDTKGLLHPTVHGHQVIKDRILYYMLPDLVPEQQQDPPQIVFSFASDGLTDIPGENGWYIGSRDSSNTYHPTVVAQAYVTSTVAMNGATLRVNGDSDCAVSGVTCATTHSDDMKQVTMTLQIPASGIYRLLFNAQNTSGQVSILEQEIKVDLVDPVLAEPIGPFLVDEGGTVPISATVSVSDDGDLNYDWDLDNDGEFETTTEQPVFSAEGMNGPLSIPIQVMVTDRAGRTDIGQSTVNVLNVTPDPVINGAPTSSDEGTAIDLTSTVIGAVEGETYTYAWEVKKDGAAYTTGAADIFSFTPDDNGLYEVSLSVTDADGDTGTTSATIVVTNVSPVLSNVAVTLATLNEGDGVTLRGSVSDAGSADAFALSIDWGDGSTPELVSLAAGSTSFNLNHTYADDNPTGTTSDTNNIALSLADDDGGEATGSASVVVNDLAPSLSISNPENGTLYGINAAVNLSATLTDPSTQDTLTCSVNWDDGTEEPGTLAAGVCAARHVYPAAGVYTIQMTGSDDDTGSKTATVMVVVYDPSAGFVTGGGWIESPAGAYIPDGSLSGRANFGFVSRYQKGASVPTGNTAFKFDLAGLEFVSSSYEWLVVNQAGTNAQFKGSGLINGAADPNGNAYKFMLWAGDGSPDTFRIRIWWEDATGEHDVYDNGTDQPIGAGSIVVHTGK